MLRKIIYLPVVLCLLASCGSSSQNEMKELRYPIGDTPDRAAPKVEKTFPEMDKSLPEIEKSLSGKVVGQIAQLLRLWIFMVPWKPVEPGSLGQIGKNGCAGSELIISFPERLLVAKRAARPGGYTEIIILYLSRPTGRLYGQLVPW